MSSLFDQWWELYPRKEGKIAAKRKFESLDEETQRLIVEHTADRAPRDKKWSEGYIPMPTTFLNQGRYLDEYEVVSSGGSTGRRIPGPVEICPGCRTSKITARHQEICENGQPYYDIVGNGELYTLATTGEFNAPSCQQQQHPHLNPKHP